MTITNAQAKNQGTYRCVASNLFGMTHSIASFIVRGKPVQKQSLIIFHLVHTFLVSVFLDIYVQIFVAPSILIFLISFLESPKAVVTPAGPVRIRVGDPINLECQAAGEPRPSVRWHRLDNNRKTMLSSPVPADSSAIMQVMGRLKSSPSWFCFYMSIKCVSFYVQILVARPEDSGTYVCTAQNNQGTTETRIEVFVEGGPQVPTVPRASVREPMIVVVEGSTTTLHCDAHGRCKTWQLKLCTCGSVVELCVSSAKGCGFNSQGTHILIKNV